MFLYWLKSEQPVLVKRERKETGGRIGSTMINLCVVLWVLAGLGGHVHGLKVPSTRNCELAAVSMKAKDLVKQALGGKRECADAELQEACCSQVGRLFGAGGPLEHCMCNAEFYSAMMLGLPAANGVHPDSYVDMLVKCQAPVVGAFACGAGQDSTEPEPLVQPTILGTLLLTRVLSRGATPPPAPAPASIPTQVVTTDGYEYGTTPQVVTMTSEAHTEAPLVFKASAPPVLVVPSAKSMPPPPPPASSVSVLSEALKATVEPQPDITEPAVADVSTKLPPSEGEVASTPPEGTTQQGGVPRAPRESSEDPVEKSQEGCASVMDIVKGKQDLTTFGRVVEASGLGGAFGLNFKGTVFAPTNSAFDILLKELDVSLDALVDSKSKDIVGSLVKLHIIADAVVKSKDLFEGLMIDTLLGGGESLTFGVGDVVKVSGAGSASPAIVTTPDIDACQAVVHVIDKVLIPSPRVAAFSGLSG